MNELVSVIIPTYKGAGNLPRAIESVLNQTHKAIEILVVDDNDPLSAARQETESVMENYSQGQIQYIKHSRNKNGAAARNTGIAASAGSFICFLDDDDFYLQDRIEKSVAIMKANPEYAGAYCGVIFANKNYIDGIIRAEKPLEQRDVLLNGEILGTGSNLFLTRKAVLEVGGFDEAFRRHQDLEFMLRILGNANVVNMDELLIVKATNGNNNAQAYKGLLEVKKMYLSKFQKAVNHLTDQEKRIFFAHQFSDLFYSALASGDKLIIAEAAKQLVVYRKLTSKEKLLVFLADKKLSKTKLYLSIKPLYNSLKKNLLSLKLKKRIDLATKDYVDKTLRYGRA